MANAPASRAKKPAAKKPAAKKAQTFSFRLKHSTDEDAATRVSVGASPRVSIGAGETFATTDPRLAARLAAYPELEEVTP